MHRSAQAKDLLTKGSRYGLHDLDKGTSIAKKREKQVLPKGRGKRGEKEQKRSGKNERGVRCSRLLLAHAIERKKRGGQSAKKKRNERLNSLANLASAPQESRGNVASGQ